MDRLVVPAGQASAAIAVWTSAKAPTRAAAALLMHAAAALDAMALPMDPKGRLPLAVCGSIGVRPAGALMLIRQAVHADREELV